jgi:DNA-directed RNA polymerase specialized sigma24 family protein
MRVMPDVNAVMNENRSAAAGIEARFTEVFGVCYQPVLAYARRRVGADLAQDVVAEAFMAAWRNFAELPPEPLPWLYRAALRNRQSAPGCCPPGQAR